MSIRTRASNEEKTPKGPPPPETGIPSRLLGRTRLAIDCVALGSAVGAAFLLRFGLGLLNTSGEPLDFGTHLIASALWVAASLAALGSNRLYDEDTLFPGGGELSRIVRSLIESVGVLSIFVFLLQRFSISRGWFAFLVVCSVLFLVTGRTLVRRRMRSLQRQGRLRRPTLLVTRDGEDGPDWFGSEFGEFEVIARLSPEEVLKGLAATDPRRPNGRRPVVFVEERGLEEDELWRIVVSAGQRGYPVFVRSSVRPVHRDRLTMRDVGGKTTMRVAPPALVGVRAFEKRAFDVAVSGLVLVLTLPIFVMVAAATFAVSGWPVLYVQERVGQDGRLFRMLKFRTMRRDAEVDTGPVWTGENDPRRTRLGRFLRRTSLDELPQLWNVLRGDMSLVGPRPERPQFADRFNREVPWYVFRNRIRPGITGAAQANGFRGNTSLDPRVEFDNWYIEHWSIQLDVKILARTLIELGRGRNAY